VFTEAVMNKNAHITVLLIDLKGKLIVAIVREGREYMQFRRRLVLDNN
jgi:hypothetical protein